MTSDNSKSYRFDFQRKAPQISGRFIYLIVKVK